MITQDFVKSAETNISRCRPGDWKHALRVVDWVKQLSDTDNLNRDLVIAAAYIHDIGWRDIIPIEQKSITKEELLKYEPEANKNTIPFVTAFLSSLNYSQDQIDYIIDLIEAADEHESQNNDESIIVDADNLSKLNIDHVREKYDQKSWPEIYTLFNTVLPERFKTGKAKKLYPELLKQLKVDIDKYSF